MQQHIFENSNHPKLKACGYYPCGRRICPWCASRLAKAHRAEIRAYAASTGLPALYIVVSVKSSPSIVAGLEALASTRAEFTSRGWLNRVSTSWFRFTELTRSPGAWHWHDNFVVFGHPEQLAVLDAEVEGRWLASASRVGAGAHAEGVHVRSVYDSYSLADYISKGLMRPAHQGDNPTPGDILHASTHNQDAADNWAQIEAMWMGRAPSLVSKSRAPRDRTPSQTPVEGQGKAGFELTA